MSNCYRTNGILPNNATNNENNSNTISNNLENNANTAPNNVENNVCRCNVCNGLLTGNLLLNTASNGNNQNASFNNLGNNNSVSCPAGNLLESLCNYIGRRCTCEFSTEKGLESKSGVLERVGNDYLVLRSLNNNKIMYCNLSGLLFVTIIS